MGRKFFLLDLLCPLEVVVGSFRFLDTKYDVGSGHVAKNPASIYLIQVSETGLHFFCDK